jgi:uncharacterized membrane protein YfcA
VRATWYVFAAIVGALACGSLFFALGSALAVYAFFRGGRFGEQAFSWFVVGSTALGVVVGVWIGTRVVRWLAVEPPP